MLADLRAMAVAVDLVLLVTAVAAVATGKAALWAAGFPRRSRVALPRQTMSPMIQSDRMDHLTWAFLQVDRYVCILRSWTKKLRRWLMMKSAWKVDNDRGEVRWIAIATEELGAGARGVTPVLPPQGEWTYESGTSLDTPYGSMHGSSLANAQYMDVFLVFLYHKKRFKQF
eukprot:s1825_g4.t1